MHGCSALHITNLVSALSLCGRCTIIHRLPIGFTSAMLLRVYLLLRFAFYWQIMQVLQKALEVWDLQVIPLDSPVAEPAQIDPELENAFICHLQDHWFCIRRVNGDWYNFDSLYAAPEHLSKFYLSAYLDSLKGAGWSIFLVRGNFTKECPLSSSESSNGYGQWLTPEDCVRIPRACNVKGESSNKVDSSRQQPTDQFASFSEAELIAMEDEDLKAAIAASLMDSSTAITGSEAGTPSREK